MKKFLTTAFFSLFVTPVCALNISFGADSFFSYEAVSSNEFGETVPSFAATGGIFAGSIGFRDDVLNTFEAIGDSDSLTLTNTSTTDFVFVEWIANGFADISGIIPSETVFDPTFFELTSFAGVTGDISFGSFSAIMGNYACSAADLADPIIFCDGVSDGQSSFFNESGSFLLGPGESFFVEVETAPLLIVSTDAPSIVPLPAGGVLLLSGLLGIGLLHRRGSSRTQ